MKTYSPSTAQRALSAISAIFLLSTWAQPLAPAAAQSNSYPILFVTQVPIPADFVTIGSVFGNHRGDLSSVGRGGDLWIRYTNGALKNLTEAAGFGNAGQQGAGAIAVRDPSVHWSGNKALFSMVVGAPTARYQVSTYVFQIYEVTGLGATDSVSITKVANQPAGYNNISPIYAADDSIIFTSDRPRNGAAHLYPQLDEYEEAATVSGLWKTTPATGSLILLNHAPSGNFTPIVDSFGRVVFTQWDHLQRDQQADTDALNGGSCTYCTFNFASEAIGATALTTNTEVFPEPRKDRADLLAGTNLNGHSFNHFFPWTINEDGADSEVLGHLGRHELHSYFEASFTDDVNLIEYYGQLPRANPNSIRNMLQVKEDPLHPGTYIGVDAPEFQTHAAGMVISMSVPPGVDADLVRVAYVTHLETANVDDTPTVSHTGLYRDPLPLSNGMLIAAHTASTLADANIGNRNSPRSRYDFRIKTLAFSNGAWAADQALTSGISKTVSYWDPDELVTYSGALWELQPVEVRARTRHAPPPNVVPLAGPEQQMFNAAGVDVAAFQAYLRQNDLALLITRDVTSRDDFDKQQPFNLRVPVSGGVQTIGSAGKIYDVAHLQIFQGDLIRGLGGAASPREGRRVLAQVLHDGPASSVAVARDGSVAAFVPARRALTWQLTDSAGVGVVRERYWVTFQPGEVRMCTNCHGLNNKDQTGAGRPNNPPLALRTLLEAWKLTQGTQTTPTPGPSPTINPALNKRVYLPLSRR